MVQLAVADWMVPCLLGTKGATLRELMAYSRATIKVRFRMCVFFYIVNAGLGRPKTQLHWHDSK